MSGLLIVLDKLPAICLVGFRETCHQIFAKCVLIKGPGPEATHTCKDDQLFAGLKSIIDRAVHGVQYIWDAKSTN